MTLEIWVKDHSDSERKPSAAPSHRQDSTCHGFCYLWSTGWNDHRRSKILGTPWTRNSVPPPPPPPPPLPNQWYNFGWGSPGFRCTWTLSTLSTRLLRLWERVFRMTQMTFVVTIMITCLNCIGSHCTVHFRVGVHLARRGHQVDPLRRLQWAISPSSQYSTTDETDGLFYNACRGAEFRTGEAGHLSRGLNNQGGGASTYVLSHFILLVFWGRVGLHSSTSKGCPGDFTCLTLAVVCGMV